MRKDIATVSNAAPQAAVSDISKITEEIDTLNRELCSKLYSHSRAALIDPAGMNEEDTVEHDDRNKDEEDLAESKEITEATDNNLQHEDYRFPEIPISTHGRLAEFLFCIEDWARWRRRGYDVEEAENTVAARFEYGYMSSSPSGWVYVDDDDDDFSDNEG